VRWETERSFDGKLCQEYSYQKLSKSDNWFSSYSRKCQGCFLGHSEVTNYSAYRYMATTSQSQYGPSPGTVILHQAGFGGLAGFNFKWVDWA